MDIALVILLHKAFAQEIGEDVGSLAVVVALLFHEEKLLLQLLILLVSLAAVLLP